MIENINLTIEATWQIFGTYWWVLIPLVLISPIEALIQYIERGSRKGPGKQPR
jgi:hypothetical protein